MTKNEKKMKLMLNSENVIPVWILVDVTKLKNKEKIPKKKNKNFYTEVIEGKFYPDSSHTYINSKEYDITIEMSSEDKEWWEESKENKGYLSNIDNESVFIRKIQCANPICNKMSNLNGYHLIQIADNWQSNGNQLFLACKQCGVVFSINKDSVKKIPLTDIMDFAYQYMREEKKEA